MDRIVPVSRKELIRRFQVLGFEGPYSGGNHEFMLQGERRITLPNPHKTDIGGGLLHRLLSQMGVSRKEWMNSK